MTDSFDGDTLITLDENGADYVLKGGDPVRDPGLINQINIACLTKKGWAGNDLEPIESRKIGSQYFEKIQAPITLQSMLDASKAAEADVKGDQFGNVFATTSNPVSQQVLTRIFVQDPVGNIVALQLLKIGKAWINQVLNPIPEGARP